MHALVPVLGAKRGLVPEIDRTIATLMRGHGFEALSTLPMYGTISYRSQLPDIISWCLRYLDFCICADIDQYRSGHFWQSVDRYFDNS